MTIKFAVKDFKTFPEGLKSLWKVSSSARQACKANLPDEMRYLDDESLIVQVDEGKTVAALAVNALFDRPTGNGVGWGYVKITVRADYFEYVTRNGLLFGWHIRPEWDYGMNPEKETHPYQFFIQHPSGEFPEGSTLLASALEQGWRTVEE